jgi:hypothetical protein
VSLLSAIKVLFSKASLQMDSSKESEELHFFTSVVQKIDYPL